MSCYPFTSQVDPDAYLKKMSDRREYNEIIRRLPQDVMSDEAHSMLTGLLIVKPEDRIHSSADAMTHEWFENDKKWDWDKIAVPFIF